jgi:hypothetical protein
MYRLINRGLVFITAAQQKLLVIKEALGVWCSTTTFGYFQRGGGIATICTDFSSVFSNKLLEIPYMIKQRHAVSAITLLPHIEFDRVRIIHWPLLLLVRLRN